MIDSDRLAQRLEWFEAGESRLLGLLATEPDLQAPSLLPGWSRAHLIAHLIGNADALGNLVRWATTGTPTPMYADPQARAAQIDRDAGRDAAWLVEQAAAASRSLSAELAGMTGEHWAAPVRTAQGREVTAEEIPWMRIRESAIHAVDLDLGVGLEWCPAPLVDALLTDITATVGGREGCPAVLVAPTDRQRTWRLGPDTAPSTVTGPAADLLTWVVGRSSGTPLTAPTPLPPLPRWL